MATPAHAGDAMETPPHASGVSEGAGSICSHMPPGQAIVPATTVERAIHVIRGQRVMLDADLARMYEVETRALVQAVGRNATRFPEDFMFRLTREELAHLKSQTVISRSWGGRRTLPLAFTEQGVAMLSAVLRSRRAILVSVEIVRVFVKLRELVATHADLARKIEALERKYDGQFQVVFEALRELMHEPARKRKRIGFH